jgi:hypothetical protein
VVRKEENRVEREKKKPSQARAKKPTRNPPTHELTTHRITATKTNLKKPPLVIRSVTLTEANEQTLENLKQTASDMLGQTVSSSALIRALLRFAEQQPSSWGAQQLHSLIEQEIAQGRVWGTKGKTGKGSTNHEQRNGAEAANHGENSP